MKKFLLIFMVLVLSIALSGCSQKPGNTMAKIKIGLGHIIDPATGLGSGGAVLYGRNHLGNIFGRTVTSSSDTFELPNGNWVFYAFTWNGDAGPMTGKVYCGKTAQQLSGSETTISMSLTNANCNDPEFSEGRVYVDGTSNNRFADFYIEECDEINALTGHTCGFDNVGSGRSYRIKLQSFKKTPTTPFAFEGTPLYSNCKTFSTINTTPLINFPSGSLSTPFVVTIEVFLGKDDCSSPDPKGVYQLVLNQGLKTQLPGDHKVLFSNAVASPSGSDFPSDQELAKRKCLDNYGTWTGSSCSTSSVPAIILKFAPTSVFAASGAANPVIKHMFAIPKPFLCDRYINQSAPLGDNPFAGGNGNMYRPFKICTEWQMNQIGEYNSPTTYETAHYKLLNDLDMNKADFGPYPKPACVGQANSVYKTHHNLNSLDKISDSNCLIGGTTANNGFQGSFNGNGKIIRNARILAESVSGLGLARKIYGGVIKNLTLVNMEVRGLAKVGAIAGQMTGSGNVPLINNIVLHNAQIEGQANNNTDGDSIGGIAGEVLLSGSKIFDVHLFGSKIRGRDRIGGLVGINFGEIKKSSFRGSIKNESSGVLIGGLTAENANSGATVTSSYSEGVMIGNSDKLAGITALNWGTVSNSYSTMTILSRSPNTSVQVAGVVAQIEAGAIVNNVFFDGVLNHKGGTTPVIAGVVAGANGGSASNCYASNSYAIGVGGCTSVNPVSISLGSNFSVATDWQKLGTTIPRLAWENRPCLLNDNAETVDNQINVLARGSEANPVVICNASQLSDLNGKTQFFKLGDDINLTSWDPSKIVRTFNGVLMGNHFALYKASITRSDDSTAYEGLFGTLETAGKIHHLKVLGSTLDNTADNNDSGTGLLVGENKGEISGIDFIGDEVMTNQYVGLVAGKNSGLISKIKINESLVKGQSYVGAVAGQSLGGANINKVDVKAVIDNLPTLSQFLGGIVGDNAGVIDQARFAGELKPSNGTGATDFRAGGIAGQNTGVISNSYTDKNSSVIVKNVKMVGGLVGHTTGSVNRSFSLGKVIYDYGNSSAPATQNFNPRIGLYTGSPDLSFTYFLENNIGSKRAQIQVSSSGCSGSGPYTCTMNAAASVGDLFDSNYGGDHLRSLIPFTPSGFDIQYAINALFPMGTFLNFYEAYDIGSNTGGQKAIADFANLDTFCAPANWSGITGNEKCSSGFDIVKENVKGHNRLMNYYAAILSDAPVPSDAPIWTMETEDGYPKLLQLDDH